MWNLSSWSSSPSESVLKGIGSQRTHQDLLLLSLAYRYDDEDMKMKPCWVTMYKGVTWRWSLFVINLLSTQMYSVGFLFLFFGHYLQQTLQSSNRFQSRIPDRESGVVFRAAAEWPAPDVISQLLYEFRILLLYLLSKLLSPGRERAKWCELGNSQSHNSHKHGLQRMWVLLKGKF